MSKELSPAFQFYPRDWLSDSNVSSMSYEQEGWYIHLICYCWMEGKIPANPALALRLVGIRERDICHCDESDLLTRFNRRHEDMQELLDMCFVPQAQLENGEAQLEGQLQYLVHPRVEKERQAQILRRMEREESGRRGGKASVKKRLKNPRSAWKQLEANTQANSTSSSSSSSSSKKTTPLTPNGGNGSEPASTGLFETFYRAYPRHENPMGAQKAFAKSGITANDLPQILDWIEKASKSLQWQDKDKIPMSSTFLNQRRWKGDPPPPRQPDIFERMAMEPDDEEK